MSPTLEEFGVSWWARRFLDVIELEADRGRLKRGAACARRGQVSDLQVRPGALRARVAGSTPRPPYVVELTAECLDAPAQGALLELLRGADPADLPRGLEAAAFQAGVTLFPRSLGFQCHCPDWAYPCKHAVAMALRFARVLDEDASWFFIFRGLDPGRLAAVWRRAAAADRGAKPAGTGHRRSVRLARGSGPRLRNGDFWGLAARLPALLAPPGLASGGGADGLGEAAGPRADLPLRLNAPPGQNRLEEPLRRSMAVICTTLADLAEHEGWRSRAAAPAGTVGFTSQELTALRGDVDSARLPADGADPSEAAGLPPQAGGDPAGGNQPAAPPAAEASLAARGLPADPASAQRADGDPAGEAGNVAAAGEAGAAARRADGQPAAETGNHAPRTDGRPAAEAGNVAPRADGQAAGEGGNVAPRADGQSAREAGNVAPSPTGDAAPPEPATRDQPARVERAAPRTAPRSGAQGGRRPSPAARRPGPPPGNPPRRRGSAATRRCAHCGASAMPSWRYCSTCGHRLDD